MLLLRWWRLCLVGDYAVESQWPAAQWTVPCPEKVAGGCVGEDDRALVTVARPRIMQTAEMPCDSAEGKGSLCMDFLIMYCGRVYADQLRGAVHYGVVVRGARWRSVTWAAVIAHVMTVSRWRRISRRCELKHS